jgi:hypothetical protein
MSAWVPVEVLDDWEIRYTRVVQRPGQLVVTAPWVYHQGWNGGWNAAEAINFGDGWSAARTRDYRHCVAQQCPVSSPLKIQWRIESQPALRPAIELDDWSVSESGNNPISTALRTGHVSNHTRLVQHLLDAKPLSENEVRLTLTLNTDNSSFCIIGVMLSMIVY